MKHTVKWTNEQLASLDLEYLTKAIHGLYSMCPWDKSPQGSRYWLNVYHRLLFARDSKIAYDNKE